MDSVRRAKSNPTVAFDQKAISFIGYKAVDSHLTLFRKLCHGPRGSQAHEDDLSGAQTEVRYLTGLFHDFLQYFRTTHGSNKLPDRIVLYVRILRFAVCMTVWLLRTFNLNVYHLQTSQEQWEQTVAVNDFFRRLWLRDRSGHGEMLPFSAHRTLRTQGPSLADHILPLFLEIASDMLPSGRALHNGFMTLSREFMVQASLDAVTSNQDGSIDQLSAKIQTCFAWGYVERATLELRTQQLSRDFHTDSGERFPTSSEMSDLISDATRLEDSISRMFCKFGHEGALTSQSGSSCPTSSEEVEGWGSLRQRGLDEMLAMSEKVSRSTPAQKYGEIAKMHERHDIVDFLQGLTDYLVQHWGMVHSDSWLGVPGLVEIDQDNPRELNKPDLNRIMKRAGIDTTLLNLVVDEDEDASRQ